MQTTETGRLEELQDWFKSKRSALVAYSGGVDSTLLAKVAHMTLGSDAIAVTSDSPSIPREELREAKEIAERIGIRHLIIETEELDNLEYARNPENRCYYCKKELFTKLRPIAEENKINVIVDGTNQDDLQGHRPGALAEEEEGIRRPFVELMMSKVEIRSISQMLGLPTADKPSMPCLASRIAYGIPITLEKLLQVEKAERIIRDLAGVKVIRVRNHGEIARIEVGSDERHLLFDEGILDKIDLELRRLGFRYVALELSGYSNGNMNRN